MEIEFDEREVHISQAIFEDWVKDSIDRMREGEDRYLYTLEQFVHYGITSGDYMIVKRFAGKKTHVVRRD